MKGLLDDSELEKYDEKTKKLAQDLSDILVKSCRRLRPLNIARTCGVLTKLSSRHTFKVVNKVLRQYIQQLKVAPQFAKSIISLHELEKKFVRLKTGYEKRSPLTGSLVSPIPEFMDAQLKFIAEKISERLGLIWPGEEKEQEVEFIKLCLYDFLQFKEAITTLEKEVIDDPKLYPLVHYLNHKETIPSNFVENWVRDIHKMAWDWNNWQGELFRYQPVLLPGMGNKLDTFMMLLTNEFCNDPSRWYEVKNLLMKRK